MVSRPQYFNDVEKSAQEIIHKLGNKIVAAAPFGIGKPNHLLNALYQRTKNDPNFHLTLITALNLEKPKWSSDLERRLVEPMHSKIWQDYPDLEYIQDIKKGNAPENFELVEFFFKPGDGLKCAHSQQNFLCSNYTHAVRDGIIQGTNLLIQQVAKKEIDGKTYYSMSSSPDTHLEAGRRLRQAIEEDGANALCVAQTNQNLPFMYGEAVVEPEWYDMVIDERQYDFQLFNIPKEAVAPADWSIGLQSSALIQDGGTIQIGFGSLGDAVAGSVLLRHQNNEAYNNILNDLGTKSTHADMIRNEGGAGIFEQGLHGSSEMFVDGMLDLYKAGILKRKVYEDVGLQRLLNQGLIEEKITQDTLKVLKENLIIHSKLTARDVDFLKKFGILKPGIQYTDGKIEYDSMQFSNDLDDAENYTRIVENCLGDHLTNGIVLNSSFFMGPESFYQALRDLSEEERREINMRGVDFVNQLYGNEELKTLQRKKGRFINAALMVRLNGSVVSHTLHNSQVLSGPGGQYNFVSMAHALPDARSIIMLRSHRMDKNGPVSNIVWEYGATTIPRHLRDIVVTEYGIADLRGKRDKEIISEMLKVADSRFQEQLMRKAKEHNKLPKNYVIPDEYRNNTPEWLNNTLNKYRQQDVIPSFPLGTQFDQEELVLGQALRSFANKTPIEKMKIVPDLLKMGNNSLNGNSGKYLKRMELDSPKGFKEKMYKRLVACALKESGHI